MDDCNNIFHILLVGYVRRVYFVCSFQSSEFAQQLKCLEHAQVNIHSKSTVWKSLENRVKVEDIEWGACERKIDWEGGKKEENN